MRKITSVLLTLIVVFSVLFACPLNVSAANTEVQDGLEVTITTDKSEYSVNEDVQISVTVKNTNAHKVEGVSLETLLPQGLVLKSGNVSLTDIDIEAGKTYSVSVIAKLSEELKNAGEGNPPTGDNSNGMLWMVLFAVSCIGIIFAVKNKKLKQVVSLLLCVVMVLNMLPAKTFAADTVPTTVEVDKVITVGGKEYTVKANVTYNSSSVTVKFDLNYDNSENSIPKQRVLNGTCATEPKAPEREGYHFVGWYLNKDDKDYTNFFDFETPMSADTTLYAVWVSDTDSDGDSLVDDLEAAYGTDKSKADTDGDGLSDFLEKFGFGTNPVLSDTDGNGTNDGAEDIDADTLTNVTEIEIKTNPFAEDTDGDGLKDGDERNVHHTDPLKVDTDNDGVSDGKELELGTDPVVAQASFSVKLSADKKDDNVTASVEIELKGEQVETLTIDDVNNDNYFPKTMPGYMGKAYDFSVNGQFTSATISFEFDETKLPEGAEPTIYYFNEANQELEELETKIEGNVASTTVTHFSKYILINRKVYEDSFTWTDVWDSTQKFTDIEIVFVIDDSGSMDWNDPSYERLNVARTLIDNLPANSKIGLVRFDGNWPKTEALTKQLTTDKEAVKNYLTRTYFYSPGGTDMYNGIQKAFPLYESTETTTLKMMIVLSDGATTDTYLHSSVVSTANDSNIRIYTVGLGNSASYFNNYLKPLAINTGASFYMASDAAQLSDIYKDINQKIDIETDSDKDGIPDYYEDNMICFNGVKLELDKNDTDSDNDNIPDGDEVQLKYEYNADKTQVKVTGKLVLGNPTNADTDGDGYTDDVDLNPLEAYKTPIILLHGLNDNTVCFGVNTKITAGMNTDYGSEYTKKDALGQTYLYTDCDSHYITSITSGRLGYYLTDSLEYIQNKNLFAFNYPNHDMVQFNGRRLSGYVSDLVSSAQNDTSTAVVDAKYIFATKDDKEQGNVKFILIGHSMGGLVSRYYIENIGTSYVEKLITIDTPHYGSGLADTSDATGDLIKFSPSIFDLNTDSTLFGGKERWWDFTVGGIFRSDAKYALENQSPALLGNQNKDVKYYAIGGYSVGRAWIVGELGQLAEALQNTVFGVEFDRDESSKANYKASINNALSAYSMNLYGETSSLDLGDADGDDTVDHMSQFAIRFNKNSTDYQVLTKSVIIINAKSAPNVIDPFHNKIHKESIMHEYVGKYVND